MPEGFISAGPVEESPETATEKLETVLQECSSPLEDWQNSEFATAPETAEIANETVNYISGCWQKFYDHFGKTAPAAWEDLTFHAEAYRFKIDNSLTDRVGNDSFSQRILPAIQQTFQDLAAVIDAEAKLQAYSEKRFHSTPSRPGVIDEQLRTRLTDWNERGRITQQWAEQMSGWQNNFLYGLLSLPQSTETHKGTNLKFFDAAYNAIHLLYNLGTSEGRGNNLLRGIVGPLQVAKLAEAAGYNFRLPSPELDNRQKVDLAISPRPNATVFLQIKSQRRSTFGSDDLLTIGQLPASADEKDQRNWQQLTKFTNSLPTNSVEAVPAWAVVRGVETSYQNFHTLLSTQPDSLTINRFKGALLQATDSRSQ